METITLNDGTLLNGRGNLDYGQLFLYVKNLTVRDGIALFNDTGKTLRIVLNSYGTETIYEGYTEITAINKIGENFNVVLTKAEGE